MSLAKKYYIHKFGSSAVENEPYFARESALTHVSLCPVIVLTIKMSKSGSQCIMDFNEMYTLYYKATCTCVYITCIPFMYYKLHFIYFASDRFSL